MNDRIDQLNDRARWYLANFDEIDLAEICANNEAAATRTATTIARVQNLRDMWAKRTDQLKRGAELLTAALAGTPLDLAGTEPQPSITGYCPACGRGDAGPTADDWEQQRKRADQVEDLLRVAHETSNRSEAERARAVQRAETAEAERTVLGRAAVEYQQRAWDAEAAVARVRAYADRLDHLAETTVRVPDRSLYRTIATDLRAALQPPARNAGPSVRECAEADARWWADKYAGEGQ